MDAHARLTSKGQVTIPKGIRDALDLHDGDQVLFRVSGDGATLQKATDFIALAGSVPVPPAVRGMAWDDVLRRAHQRRGTDPT
jgi:AbrB family looped-hinge helix DNA binding protein